MKIIKINAIWCPSCLIMNKVFNSLALKYPKIEIISYDYDFDSEIVKTYNVGNNLPVFIFVKDNKEIKRICGEFKEIEIIKIIEELVK